MARYTKNRNLEPVISAFEQWIRQCLIEDGSILSPGKLWTSENVAEARNAFVDHPIEGKEKFTNKLKSQMQNTSPDAQQLMAEMVWALLLFPTNINPGTKREQIRAIWSLSGNQLPDDHPILSDEVLAGIGSGGTGFNNHRWRELVFLLDLVTDLKRRNKDERRKILTTYDDFVQWVVKIPQEGNRQFRHMFKFLAHPDRVERIASNSERLAILDAFHIASKRKAKNWTDPQIDGALFELRKKLEEQNPNEILDFYEEPLRSKWRALVEEPDVAFTVEDCEVFNRYPNGRHWSEVPQADQAIFKGIWSKLKGMSTKLAASVKGLTLKADTSHYVPNGRSPKEIWCCVYPSSVSNKSYALQVATIISSRGAEVCFCMGSGTSQVGDVEKKHNLETEFESLRKRLRSLPQGLISTVEQSQQRRWFYRKAWLETPNVSDFSTLGKWLEFTGHPNTNGASISTYFNPHELEELGEDISNVFMETLKTFRPIMEAIYSNDSFSRHWIFQGNPNYYDIDTYLRSKKEIRWSIRQYKNQVKPHDKVLIWKSGLNGGVIANCSILTPPSTDIEEDAPELVRKEQEKKADAPRCKLEVLQSFVDNPISISSIRAILPDLIILKFPNATNFEISSSDYEQILNLGDSDCTIPLFDCKILDEAHKAISATHMRITSTFLSRFVTSLAAKPFVILTGNSGTGKTKLAQLFAHWLTGSSDNQKGYVVVPVGADWTDNRNIIGFVNHLRKESNDNPVYQGTPALDLILNARMNRNRPFFLILDEMNLSHVERYFADFLSSMESHKPVPLHAESKSLMTTQGLVVENSVTFPDNLFVIGTVNIDETTYMFSPKVLDRANVLEFRVSETEAKAFLADGSTRISEVLTAVPDYGEAFLRLCRSAQVTPIPELALSQEQHNPESPAIQKLNHCKRVMEEILSVLRIARSEFAYRTMAEVLRYVYLDFELASDRSNWDWTNCMDAQILQKILPKLHGSKKRIGPLLVALAKYCEQGMLEEALIYAREQKTSESFRPIDNITSFTPKFEMSYEKLCEMVQAVRRDQFVSFIQ